MRALLAAGALILVAASARADGIDEANAAVKAAQAGQYDDAIQHFTAAIDSDELNLTSRAQAFAYRGIARATTGDYGGAKSDLDLAVALDSPYNADAYAFRGLIELVTGDADKAATDLAKSARMKIWSYNVLWLALARAKAHVPDTDDVSLKANAAMLKMDAWPGPMVRYLMGQEKRENLLPAAQMGDPARLKERVCDVDFYTAEFDLAHGDRDVAKPLLANAADKCPFASFERMGATAELARLK